MFSAITMNWRGRPLETHEVVVETIAATTSRTGLRIQAMLDTNTYQKGIKITDQQMKTFEAAHLQRHDSTASGTTRSTPRRVTTRHARPNITNLYVSPNTTPIHQNRVCINDHNHPIVCPSSAEVRP